MQARLGGGVGRMAAALLLAALLAAAPAAATYYQSNPKCPDGSTPNCSGSSPIRTDCCDSNNVQQWFSNFFKRADCGSSYWNTNSCSSSSSGIGFTSYGFLMVPSTTSVDFQLSTFGGSAVVQLDDDDDFMGSGALSASAGSALNMCFLWSHALIRCMSRPWPSCTCSGCMCAPGVAEECLMQELPLIGPSRDACQSDCGKTPTPDHLCSISPMQAAP